MDIFADMERIVSQTMQTEDDSTIYYTPLGGSRVKQDDVIFRSPVVPVVGDDLIFEGTGPQFSVLREDIPGLKQGDLFERDSVIYVVKTVDKDESYRWTAHCRLN